MKLLFKQISLVMLLGMFAFQSSFAVAKPAQMPDYYKGLPWKYGEAAGKGVKLCNVLEVKLPEGYASLEKAGTQQLNRLTENPETDECATIAPTSMDWFVMFRYDPIGYVKDDEKIDPDQLLKEMKEGNEVGNEERKKHGWAPLEMVGWVIKPTYDKEVNRLIWATKLRSGADESVNYETRILGREGVTEVILVSAPEDMDRAVKEFNELAKKMEYVQGKRYDEFTDGDRIAKVGLAALITGGAVAAAVQTGLLANLGALLKGAGKLIGAAVIGVGAFVVNLFRRKKKEGTEAEGTTVNIDDENNQPPTV